MRTYLPVCPHAGETRTGGSAIISLGNSFFISTAGDTRVRRLGEKHLVKYGGS
jgi:hypothetical protein